ncbi:uncharacterized protein LOC131150838 isoform X2 [Malania oleifera]|uniref:uncharacterized protein LOC131150838 isoform X2 n=1 Tax=Malania oleifera TaxID=397392 RepID=UPI0025AEA4BD|nr:uncharacterized protein LOC131150838 isoform X2 [Malania oleifera]
MEVPKGNGDPSEFRHTRRLSSNVTPWKVEFNLLREIPICRQEGEPFIIYPSQSWEVGCLGLSGGSSGCGEGGCASAESQSHCANSEEHVMKHVALLLDKHVLACEDAVCGPYPHSAPSRSRSVACFCIPKSLTSSSCEPSTSFTIFAPAPHACS